MHQLVRRNDFITPGPAPRMPRGVLISIRSGSRTSDRTSRPAVVVSVLA